MKLRLKSLTLKTLFLLFLCVSCTFSSLSLELKRGEEAEKNQNYKEALEHYKRLIKRSPDAQESFYAAKKMANLAVIYLNDYSNAIFAYRHIIMNTDVQNDRVQALEQIAKVYFDKLNQYENAIQEFSRLNEQTKDVDQLIESKYYIARSYFYLNRMFQAEVEIDELMKIENPGKKLAPQSVEYKFRAQQLLAGIKHTAKDYQAAIDIYNKLIQDFPKLSREENVIMNLAISYEDTKQLDLALQTLESIKDDYKDKIFIEQKMARLKEKMAQQPGAKGFRK